jgi:hypothetical protein
MESLLAAATPVPAEANDGRNAGGKIPGSAVYMDLERATRLHVEMRL